MKRCCIPLSGCAVLAAVLWLAAVPAATRAEDYDDFSELDLSALLDQVVVTAAKHEQKISDSPVSAYVITAEDIAVSGALGLPELLRDVPGMDVITTSASHDDVGARGLNHMVNNTILVLLDGRSVYFDFYGASLWEALPVALEEIRAVEVILGPGSAYYGANAFACVINIITFDADELQGTIVRGAAEASGAVRGSLVHSGAAGGLDWRASSSFSRNRDWELERQESEMLRGNAKLAWRTGAESRLVCDAGVSRGNIQVRPTTQTLDIDGTVANVGARYTWRDLEARLFWNGWSLDVIPSENDDYLDFASHLTAGVLDLELNHVVRPGGGHRLQWGGEIRRKTLSWILGGGDRTQDIVSGFVADEWRANDRLLFSLGLRYDDHPLVGGHLAPRAGVVVRPGGSHSLRASYGVAYRDPTYIESYWWSEVEIIPGYPQTVRGNPDLDSEQLRSLEIGYQGLLNQDVKVGLAVYRNEVRRLIQFDVLDTYDAPPAPISGIPLDIAFLNLDGWLLRGGEATVDVRLSDRIAFRGFWTCVRAEDLQSGRRVERVPRHVGSATVVWKPAADHRAEISTHYRAGSAWNIDGLATGPVTDAVPALTTLDLTWHWRVHGGDTRLVAGVTNLLDERGRDHPLAVEQRRRLRLSLRTGL